MSNYLAVATVTATLQRVLESAVNADGISGPVRVTAVRPDGSGTGTPETGVNIFLYQVTPNPAWSNADLPTRRANGQLQQRPRTALDLHYLFTFYGDDREFVKQRLLGSALRYMHARPFLTRQMIRAMIEEAMNPQATNPLPFFSNSNLADDLELVKFTPIPLSLEELSKLWSVFFQTAYNLSVAYQASVVLIESEDTPQAALPVRERNLYVVPFRRPFIEEVSSSQGPQEPITVGTTLRIVGRQLRAEDTLVRIGGVEVAPSLVSDTRIELLLSTGLFSEGSLRAGVQGAQVIHQIRMGTPPKEHHGVESNLAAFVLRPTITLGDVSVVGGEPETHSLALEVTPPLADGQRVVLLLNETSSQDPAAYTFTFVATTDEKAKDNKSKIFVSDTTPNAITLFLKGVKAGTYFVRLQVDGAESPLDTDESSSTFGPKVTIP